MEDCHEDKSGAVFRFVLRDCLALLKSAASADASTIAVFNDFGPGNTYQCCQAAPIAGSDSVPRLRHEQRWTSGGSSNARPRVATDV